MEVTPWLIEAAHGPRPPVSFAGEDEGNVFPRLGICRRALIRAGEPELARELTARVAATTSYEEALSLFATYCAVQGRPGGPTLDRPG